MLQDFLKWFRIHGWSDPVENKVLLKAGREAVIKAAETEKWWEWDKGSSIFFWRWPKDYQDIAREGLPPMFDSPPPKSMEQQPPYADENIRQKVKENLERVLKRGYVVLADIQFVESMMYMFHVPKGEDDIRMVYDGTESGLNKTLYAPWFALPTVDSMSRWVVAGSWLADNDYGDMLLNFPLHPDLQKFCGVDLSQLFLELSANEGQRVIGIWVWNAMGLRPSPYASIQGGLCAKKKIVTGKRNRKDNAYQWDKLLINLPFAETYLANLPKLRKVRRDGDLASEIVMYVDDNRIVAANPEQAWLASSQMAKGLCWLGLQDAAQKR